MKRKTINTTKTSLVARSPAKLILSGEHSVVYGKPAIAMAINRYTESTIMSSLSSAILFNCLNLKYAKSFTLHTLKVLKRQLQHQYYEFLEGRCNIREVLKRPFELLQYTVTHLIETWDIPLSKNQGLEIYSSSEIPIGCGMGSSAALVMSTLYALAHFFKIEIDPIRTLKLGREAENLQHGYSSGIDLQLAMEGGCLRYQQGSSIKRNLPQIPLTIVQTGRPLSTTGECVTNVAKYFKESNLKESNLLEEFAAVTEQMDSVLQSDHLNLCDIQNCIRLNHRLLVKIGVVPEKVRAFIAELEKENLAAKICGAGAVRGEKAGVILVAEHERDPCNDSGNQTVSMIAQKYGYYCQRVNGDLYGTHLV